MTRIILFIFLCIKLVSADEYPAFFAQLGTPLYEADKAFLELSGLKDMRLKADAYHTHVQELLIFAGTLEKDPKQTKKNRSQYIKRLRTLQTEHDDLLRTLNASLLKSIDADNFVTFSRIMNVKLAAILQNNVILKRSMAYYVGHRTRGKIDRLEQIFSTLDSDTALLEYVRGHLPKTEQIVDLYSSSGVTHKHALSKNEKLAYLAKSKHCFKIIDISDFSSASEISSFEFLDHNCQLSDLSLSQDFERAYLSDINNGFAILNIGNQTMPIIEGEYTKIKAVSALASKDDKTVFVVRKNSGLSILDVSNKEEPKLLSTYNRGLKIRQLALDENSSRLYLVHADGLSVLDISTLGNPKELFNFTAQTDPRYLLLSPEKKLAYLASGEKGVQVLDLSEDQNISLISNYQTPAAAAHLTLSQDGNTLFVSALSDGVYQVNAKDPSYLKHIMTYTLGNDAQAFSTSLNKAEDTLFISYGKAGLAKVAIKLQP